MTITDGKELKGVLLFSRHVQDHDRLANKPLDGSTKLTYFESAISHSALLKATYSQVQTTARFNARLHGTSDAILFEDLYQECLTVSMNASGAKGGGRSTATIAAAQVDSDDDSDEDQYSPFSPISTLDMLS